MKQAIVLITICLFLTQPSWALFRSGSHQTAAQGSDFVEQRVQHYRQFFANLASLDHKLVRHRGNPDRTYFNAEPGTFAFICGVFGLVCLAAVALSPYFLIGAFISGIFATIFGAIGLKRHKRGFAIAGMILGILEVVIGIMVLGLAAFATAYAK